MLGALLAVSSSAYSDQRLRFEATLSGAQEVTDLPGGVDTETTAKIKVNFDEALTQAEFELRVFDGTGIRVAHFYCGRAGENGPVEVFLFGPVDAGVDVDGELAEGTVTNADFRVAVLWFNQNGHLDQGGKIDRGGVQ
jgi:CHRD domain